MDETVISDLNPYTNPKAIALVQQSDGNWKGYGMRFGKMVVVREMSPNDCLVKLLTHDGA